MTQETILQNMFIELQDGLYKDEHKSLNTCLTFHTGDCPEVMRGNFSPPLHQQLLGRFSQNPSKTMRRGNLFMKLDKII